MSVCVFGWILEDYIEWTDWGGEGGLKKSKVMCKRD